MLTARRHRPNCTAPQIVSLTKSKSGKHGHAKVKMTGLDVFTGDKFIGYWPTSHTAFAPEGGSHRATCSTIRVCV